MSSILLPNSCPIKQTPAILILRGVKSGSFAETDMH
jgi:hypothetical protein